MASWLYEEQTSGRRIDHRLRSGNFAFSDCQAGPVLVDMEARNDSNVCPNSEQNAEDVELMIESLE
jgi:hypothetical protein